MASCLIKYTLTDMQKIEGDFMVMSVLFKFCEDWMSSFEDMTNNISTNQVPAAK